MGVPKKKSEQEEPLQERDESSSELWARFRNLQPLYASGASAVATLARDLEKLAAQHGMSVEALLREAHTTSRSLDYHREALSLERRIALLRR